MLMKMLMKKPPGVVLGGLIYLFIFTIIGIIRFAGASGLVPKAPVHAPFHRERLFCAAWRVLGIKIYHCRADFLV